MPARPLAQKRQSSGPRSQQWGGSSGAQAGSSGLAPSLSAELAEAAADDAGALAARSSHDIAHAVAEHWVERRDETTGRVYYFNTSTGATVLTRPEGV
jgi:hypothetical protein